MKELTYTFYNPERNTTEIHYVSVKELNKIRRQPEPDRRSFSERMAHQEMFDDYRSRDLSNPRSMKQYAVKKGHIILKTRDRDKQLCDMIAGYRAVKKLVDGERY